MKIIYHNLHRNPALEKGIGAMFVNKETLLKESDFLTLHVPLTPETRHYIGEKELKLMKETAVLINASRGPVVDEKALFKALQEKQIWGAGLDVFENEPEIVAGLATNWTTSWWCPTLPPRPGDAVNMGENCSQQHHQSLERPAPGNLRQPGGFEQVILLCYQTLRFVRSFGGRFRAGALAR